MTRQITTVEQLDALPVGTVMRTRDRLLCEIGTLLNDERVIWSEGWSRFDDAIEHLAPFTVLYEPGEQRPTHKDDPAGHPGEQPRPLPDRDQIADALRSNILGASTLAHNVRLEMADAVLALLGGTVDDPPCASVGVDPYSL